MDRDFNRQEVNVPGTSSLDVAGGPDVRRGMVMARDVAPLHPELVENLSFTRTNKVEPFGADLIHWGSIWGGFFTYLALTLILVAAAVSIGAISVTPTTAGAPPASQVAGTVGVGMAVIMLLSTFVGALLAGWTSNIRSRWPAIVNGIVYASLVVVAPVLVTMLLGIMSASAAAGAVAQAQAAQGNVFLPGGFGLNAATLDTIAANVGWFSIGSLLLLTVGALGYLAGMRAHLADLGLNRRTIRS